LRTSIWMASIMILLLLPFTLPACSPASTSNSITSTTTVTSTSKSTTSTTTETSTKTEATQYQGTTLTPIADQRNNALEGTQYIDRNTYRLVVDGLVDRPLSLSYDELLSYPQISKASVLFCVENWQFTAKWTGPSLSSILADAGVQPSAKILIFHTADVLNGYDSLTLDYVRNKNIIIGMKLNDVTLPADRGFPFQVVAEGKYGYKWAKWVTRIEVSDDTSFVGYWEHYGYSNDASLDKTGFGLP
jgi:DMSO/TMAO reductase YedYZ molybdopterin-dependent catalytic subunit